MQINSKNITASENNLKSIQRKTAENRKRSDRNTSHIKLLNKCNVAEEDDGNCQLEVEKQIEWVKKKIFLERYIMEFQY